MYHVAWVIVHAPSKYMLRVSTERLVTFIAVQHTEEGRSKDGGSTEYSYGDDGTAAR